MQLKDDGVRRDFGTGAVRDIAEGKGRCDLLPLNLIADLDPGFAPLHYIEAYIRHGDPEDLITAIKRAFGITSQEIWCRLLLDLAQHYEDGAKKYSERNWENGIPLHCFIDSGVRHFLKWQEGLEDERHHLAFTWNLLGAVWTQKHHANKATLMDLPFCETRNWPEPARATVDSNGIAHVTGQARLNEAVPLLSDVHESKAENYKVPFVNIHH